MSTLEIVTYPDEFLHKPTKPVENIDGEFQKFIDSMAETRYAATTSRFDSTIAQVVSLDKAISLVLADIFKEK